MEKMKVMRFDFVNIAMTTASIHCGDGKTEGMLVLEPIRKDNSGKVLGLPGTEATIDDVPPDSAFIRFDSYDFLDTITKSLFNSESVETAEPLKLPGNKKYYKEMALKFCERRGEYPFDRVPKKDTDIVCGCPEHSEERWERVARDLREADYFIEMKEFLREMKEGEK